MTSQPASEGLFESFRRAEMLIARSRPLDALQALGPVLESQPNDASVQLLAGRAYLNSAQLRLAEQMMRRVIELDPAATKPACECAHAWLSERGDARAQAWADRWMRRHELERSGKA